MKPIRDYLNKKNFSRLTVALLLPLALSLVSCDGGSGSNEAGKKVLVLGFDGMDPVLLKRYMAEGFMPNFKRVADEGGFTSLTTSMPPQSPVAWSNFITGMNPGGHGIFDFIGRDPKTYMPYLSTSKTEGAGRSVTLGDWTIPFSGGETLLMRKGKPFWEILEDNGIASTVIKVPANFPPVKGKARTLSGMGTPDILGTYGTFTFYTTGKVEDEEEIVSGRLVSLKLTNNSVSTTIYGPPNPFRKDGRGSTVMMTVAVDRTNPVAHIKLPGTEVLLNVGEWSDWVELNFALAPTQSITGIARFFLIRAGAGELELYMSPINIDPFNPTVPVSSPEEFAAEVATEIGYFYTQGMPEDTKALDQDFLSFGDFLKQLDIIFEERLKMLYMELKRFHSGLLFFYFSTTDPIQHMFWRTIDKGHPAYDSDEAGTLSNVIRDTYVRMDSVMEGVLKSLDSKTTLIVVSDHGFGSFRRHFHMNRWLKKNGYIGFKNSSIADSGEFFENVDFNKTRAYALGFNGVYINLEGREGSGIVSADAKEDLMDDIIGKLEAVRDPRSGEKVISKVYKREELYSGEHMKEAPDLLIGYNRGYRASWETALGKIPVDLFGDNMKKWSGTHLWDFRLVPGVVLSNRPFKKEAPALYDIAPTILSEFGIKKDNDMVGTPIF